MSAFSRESSIARKKASTGWDGPPIESPTSRRSGGTQGTRRAHILLTVLLLVLVAWGLVLTVTLYLTDDSRPSDMTVSGGARNAPGSDAQVEFALDAANQGNYAQAIASLQAVVTDDPSDSRPLFLLARTQHEAGDPAASLSNLDTYLARFPSGESVPEARLLRGELRADVGDLAGAALDLAAYTETGGPASSHALLRLGDIAAEAENDSAAINYYSRALGGSLSGYQESQVMLQLVELERSRDDLDRAIYWAERTAVFSPSTADRITALARLAELELQSGDRASWVDTSKRLVIEYPGSDAALDALDSLLQNGVPVSLVQQAQVRLAHGDRSGAELLLLGAVTRGGPSEVAEAAFRLGLLRELAGDAEGALAWFELSQPDASAEYAAELELHRLENSLLVGDDSAAAAIEQYAIAHRGSISAISAANSLARFYESEADFPEAARLRLGAAQFALEAGDTDAAIEAAERAAKLFFQVEDDQSAYAALLSVASADPGSFAAIRAESRLGDSRSSQLPAHYVDVSIETWIEDFAASSTSLASERMHAASAAAVELQTAGLHPESDSQMADIIPLARHSPAFLSNLGTQAASNGQTAVAARSAGALLASLSPDVRQHVPRRLGELAYPRPYLEIAENEARSVGLDPLLLYALIRQESFFDPLAHSPAQARGLTQIIPATAHEIASRLGVQGFVQEDLYRPTISLAFGAYYLAAQLDAFDGFPYAALAAYNGGPGNARRWGSNGGFTDSDVYLSQIDFEETHNYVRRVMENYAHYRALYLGETRPRLPE